MSKLTIIEIGAEARRRAIEFASEPRVSEAFNYFADWIIDEGAAREKADKEAWDAPFETTGGLVYPGRKYNLTYTTNSYRVDDSNVKTRTAKGVLAVAKGGGYPGARRSLSVRWIKDWGNGHQGLSRQLTFYDEKDLKRIIKVEEIPA